jgi:formylglycine-generating enzyme required for sulfatase activity
MKRLFIFPFIILITSVLWITCQRNSKSNISSKEAGDVITDPSLNMEMIFIPSGTFIMGNDQGADDEDPAHEVFLDAFYIGKYVVTQKQWKEIMGNNPSDPLGDDLPVVNVSWEDAQEFVKCLSERTGQTYRLPTEAEWECACRAGSTTIFHFGNDTSLLTDYAWCESNSNGKLHPVGQKKPNAWGLYDMAGNTWEWCEDWWDPEYYSRSPHKNPLNKEPYLYESQNTGEKFTVHVARSGAFGHAPSAHESAHRHGTRPNHKRPMISFRCVREVEKDRALVY